MAWRRLGTKPLRRLGTKPLSEPMMDQFIDAYMRHSASVKAKVGMSMLMF